MEYRDPNRHVVLAQLKASIPLVPRYEATINRLYDQVDRLAYDTIHPASSPLIMLSVRLEGLAHSAEKSWRDHMEANLADDEKLTQYRFDLVSALAVLGVLDYALDATGKLLDLFQHAEEE